MARPIQIIGLVSGSQVQWMAQLLQVLMVSSLSFDVTMLFYKTNANLGSLSIDLYNDTELASSGLDFDVVFRDPTNLLDLTFRPNAQGAWQLATVSGENGNGTLCNMEVDIFKFMIK